MCRVVAKTSKCIFYIKFSFYIQKYINKSAFNMPIKILI